MIVCRQCGQAADESADFCPSCGAYLAWEGEPVGPGTHQGPAGERPGPGDAPPPGAPMPTPPPQAGPSSPSAPPAAAPPPGAVPSPPSAGGGAPSSAGAWVPPSGGEGAPSPPPPPGGDAGARPTDARSGAVICLECGARNEGDRRFCRRCGSTLDLVALSRRAPRPDPPAPPFPAPDASPTGDTTGSPGGPAPVPSAPGVGTGGPGGLVARPPSAPVPAPPGRVGARPPATPPVVGPVPARGVQPTEPKARPAPVRPQRVEAEVAPGGPDCPQCGTANPPGRRFCRRCGADLPAAAASTPDAPERAERREPWWRRLFRRRSRDGEAPSRSARAAYRRSLDIRYRVMRVVAVVAGLGVMAGGLGLVGVNPVSGARSLWDRFFPRDERIGELQAATDPAGAVVTDFTPGNAVDGDADTAWATTWLLEPDAPAAEPCADDESTTGSTAEPAGGDAAPRPASAPTGGGEAALVIALPEATELSKISVQPGLAPGDPDRALHWQPTRLELRFDDGTCAEVELADEAGFQDHRIDAPETSTVRVSVLDAAEPRAPEGATGLVAIGEVRLFAPK